jgi:NADP-dependent 3-hydroxy acid dehydrogenase YdfG
MEQRVILVTGSSGIGAATARLTVERGHRVFPVGKVTEECDATPPQSIPAKSDLSFAP